MSKYRFFKTAEERKSATTKGFLGENTIKLLSIPYLLMAIYCLALVTKADNTAKGTMAVAVFTSNLIFSGIIIYHFIKGRTR